MKLFPAKISEPATLQNLWFLGKQLILFPENLRARETLKVMLHGTIRNVHFERNTA